MREIKFRVWDGSKMRSLWQALDTGLVVIQRHKESFAIEPDYDDVEILQFTGMKDKNGVDIYEGDIIQGEWGEQLSELPKEEFNAQVIFMNGCFLIDWWMSRLSLENASIGITWRQYYHNNKDRYYETTPLEVVGNIYQNKELLK